MVDSDDVLLLRPTDPPYLTFNPQPCRSGDSTGDGDVHVTVWLHEPGAGTCTAGSRVHPMLAAALDDVATWRTEPAENTFPALPVRAEHAFVG